MVSFKALADRVIGYRSSRQFTINSGNVLKVVHDAGFFSNCSVILKDLAASPVHPCAIDASESFRHYRTESTQFHWEDFFTSNSEADLRQPSTWITSRTATRLPHHSLYRFLNFSVTSQILGAYFQPSRRVIERAEHIASEHLTSPLDEILVICIRGTDKATEVRPSPLHSYVRRVRSVIRRNRNLKVWVQTDQLQIRDFLLQEIGDNAFAIDVLPVTADDSVIHRSGLARNPNEFALDLLATVLLMSRAHSVITYTGNVGYWIALFRGNSRRLYQLR